MNNELYHYGVIGMKWGVRRYQDENGKLTSEGRAKYRQDKIQIREENKVARSLGSSATKFALATNRAMSREAVLRRKADKALTKDPNANRYSTKNKMAKTLAAHDAVKALSIGEKMYTKLAQQHVERLKKEYGNDVVKDIKYKDISVSSKTANTLGIREGSKRSIVYEGRGREAAKSALHTTAVAAGSALVSTLIGTPLVMLSVRMPASASLEQKTYNNAWKEHKSQLKEEK